MSWNNLRYRCTCGTCPDCVGERNRKSIYKAPSHVRERFFQKKASEEEALRHAGYIIVGCPGCGRDRQVLGSSLAAGFSCDKCGFTAKGTR